MFEFERKTCFTRKLHGSLFSRLRRASHMRFAPVKKASCLNRDPHPSDGASDVRAALTSERFFS
jgi:hypothetical protein